MKLRLAIAALAVALLAGTVYWQFFRAKPSSGPPEGAQAEGSFPPDPRLAYSGPFHNVHPAVGYVGDAKCAECHPEIAATYSRHPMGRSTVPATELAGRLPVDEAHHNPFTAFDILFRVDRDVDAVLHRQTRLDSGGKPIYEFAHRVDYAVGSGARGHSYLTVRDGFVFQTPISWFSQKQLWDLSPGFPPWARAGRLVQGACLYCHSNRVEPVEHTRNQYHEPVFRGHAIGCERCHGPGERHARSLAKDDIVDPKRLEPALREAVCQQCHLEGATRVLRRGRGLNDFRPGMPLTDFWTVFVRGPGSGDGHKAVNHVEQMYESVCFQKSPVDRKMGCISCHNPHEAVPPEKRVAYYRNRCAQCHTDPQRECSVPVATRRRTNPDDSCVACHMPKTATSDVVHTASSDHRIVRRPGEERTRPAASLPLLDFFRGPPDLQDTGLARDFGLATYHVAPRGGPMNERAAEFALGLLDRALAECPGDVDAWEAKGKLLQSIRRPGPAVESFEAILKRAPRHETALVTLATMHRDQGEPDQALRYWRAAVEVNPWVAEYRKNLVTNLAERGAWEELRPHCVRWLELDPASVEARCAWVQYLFQSGKKGEAVAEYGKVRALKPPDLPQLDAWFARLLR